MVGEGLVAGRKSVLWLLLLIADAVRYLGCLICLVVKVPQLL